MAYEWLALASALFGATANILARVLLKDVTSKQTLVVNFILMALTLFLLSPTFYRFDATVLAMTFVILIAFIDTLANYFYFKTFENTDASVATPLLSLAPAFTFIFSWLLLAEAPSAKIFFLAVCILLSIIYFSAENVDISTWKSKTLLPALLASILFGLSAIPARYVLHELNAINAPTLYMFRAGFIALFATWLCNFPVRNLSIQQYRILFGRGILVIIQWTLLYAALNAGLAGVTMTLSSITPIFVFLFGIIFLREKCTFRKLFMSVGVLLLALLIL